MNSEQVTDNSEQGTEQSAVTEPVEAVEMGAEAVAEEEKPSAEYVENFVLDEPEPELQPTEIVMENLRPVGASPSEPSSSAGTPSPVKPPSGTQSPAPPEQRTAPIVPTVRESWRQPTAPQPSPKDDLLEMPAIVQEPVVNEQQEERILHPDYPIMFSRVARVTVGQLVEIPFRGRDWVFLGEVGARRGIAYDSRRQDPEGESFVFRIEAAGVYALKFYRQDFVRDLIFNDHVRIIAGEAAETTGLAWFNPPVDRSRVIVGPRWPNLPEPQPSPQRSDSHAEQQLIAEGRESPTTETKQTDAKAGQPPAAAQPSAAPPAAVRPPSAPPAATRPPAAVQPPAATQPPAQPSSPSAPKETTPVPAPEPVSPDTILKQAREEFSAGRVAAAITLLDQFCKSFPSGSDEAWWLYGQCFEANSPNRNMLSALEYYRRLVREYPMSSRLNDARRRISYLERYYINIQ